MSNQHQQEETSRQKENQSHNSDNSARKSKQKSAMDPPNKTTSNSNAGKKKSITISSCDGKGGGRGDSDDHETHIWTERERRKRMRNMFASLHAMLPHLPSKADKPSIVDEAVSYIKTLDQTLQKLQKQKQERLQSVSTTFGYPYGNYSREAFIADQGANSTIPTSNPSIISQYSVPPVGFQTWVSPNLVLNICGEEAQFSVCSSKKQCLFSSICFVLEKHKIEVLSAHISSDKDNNRCLYMIQGHTKRDPDQLPEAFSVEETFRQAAGEIMLWLS